MGIRFRCPNGHKLNIKTFLAGKRGVCPDCGVSFRIPTEEAAEQAGKELLIVPEWKSGRDEEAAERGSDFSSAGGTAVAVASKSSSAVFTPASISSEPAAPVAKGAAPVATPAAKVAPSVPASPATVAVPVTSPVAIPAVSPAMAPVGSAADPCAEAPLANWYVRSPAGGQYGPAKGDVMRKWIGEGRVSADSLVWREGFPEWRVAAEIFPQLARSAMVAAPVAAAAAVVPSSPMATVAASPDPAPAMAARSIQRYASRKQTGNFFGLVAFFGLIVLCLGLLIVLAILLTRSYNEPQEKSPSKDSKEAAAVPRVVVRA